MARPLKHNPEPALSIDATDADSTALKSEVKQKNAAMGKTTRTTSGRKTVKRNPDDLGASADGLTSVDASAVADTSRSVADTCQSGVGASGASEYVAVQLPVPTELKLGDIIRAPQDEAVVYQTFVVRSDEASLSQAQTVAVEMLADMMVRRTIQDVAKALSIDDATLYRWFRNPVFTSALELRKRENFLNIARIKAYSVYDKELDAKVPSSRMMEQIAKTLGFFSDADTINLEVNVSSSDEQTNIDVGRDGPY